MKHRSPLAVFFLPIITLGIYGIVWQVKTKNEMNKLGADIPTAWLLIVPFVNWYWLWRYSEGVEKVTKGETSTVLSFVLLFLLGIVGFAILQNEFNKVGDQPAGVAVGTPTAFAAAPVQTPDVAQPALPAQPITNPEPPVGPTQPPTVADTPPAPLGDMPPAPAPGPGPDQPLPPTPPQNPPLV